MSPVEVAKAKASKVQTAEKGRIPKDCRPEHLSLIFFARNLDVCCNTSTSIVWWSLRQDGGSECIAGVASYRGLACLCESYGFDSFRKCPTKPHTNSSNATTL
eukprot:3092174-Amphidinium_carterae.1